MPELLVNTSGTIANLLFLGFTIIFAFGELIDNAIDAGAKKITVGLITRIVDGVTHYYYYIADGKGAAGMTRRELSQSCNVNNHNS